MNHITFQPKGVCSFQIDFDIDDENKLHNTSFMGGCNGNLKAIGRLVEGKDAAEIADILGINAKRVSNALYRIRQKFHFILK